MTELSDLIRGEPSGLMRVVSSLAPALFLFAYFLIGLVVYGVRWAVKGDYSDAEMEGRRPSFLVGRWLRLYFVWVTRPFWFLVRQSDIPAAAMTTLSMLLALSSGMSIAVGRFALGGWLYLLSGILDIFDGRQARAQGTAGPRGAALDSILDRYSDGVVLIGFAWFYRDSWVLLAVLTVLLGTMMISYIKARGQGVGVDIDVGPMQRAERILYLGAATAFSPVLEAWLTPDEARPVHLLAVIGLLLLAIGTHVTAVRRFCHLMKRLEGAPGRRRWTGAGRGSLLRAQLSSAAATLADFAAVIAFVELAGLYPWMATFLGYTFGGGINFVINRTWALDNGARLQMQVSRYALVNLSSAALNSGGITVFLFVPAVSYPVAWALARLAIALAWNYPLQRDYVFKPPRAALAEARHQ